MRFLLVQENGRKAQNRHFRECFSYQRALVREGHEAVVWGPGHDNYEHRPDFRAYDVILTLENYDETGWLPDLSSVGAYKILWVVDAHVRGMRPYRRIFKTGQYQLILQATRDYTDRNVFGWRSTRLQDGATQNSLWFPNWFDDELIGPRSGVPIRADVGFCGHVRNREEYLAFLARHFAFVSDVGVLGEDMVRTLNSYKVGFNKNMACDVNYRTFETIGCGVPLITDGNPQLEALGLVDERNCLTYGSYGELKEKLTHVLQHDELRQQIGREGHLLSRQHTCRARVQMLLAHLKQHI